MQKFISISLFNILLLTSCLKTKDVKDGKNTSLDKNNENENENSNNSKESNKREFDIRNLKSIKK